jgi:hypothetical protein
MEGRTGSEPYWRYFIVRIGAVETINILGFGM